LFPGRVRMVIHPEIPTADLTTQDHNELRRKTHAVIESSQPESLR